MEKEKTIRLGVLTRLLRRAECIEEGEFIIGLELDEQTDLVTLYLDTLD